MHKLITLFILIIGFYTSYSQQTISFHQVDSLSYDYWYKGDWQNLLKLGDDAIEQAIDFKKLRQRLGYAHYISGDYVASEKQYLKAYEFDSYDFYTRTYLYLNALYQGNEANARYYLDKLTENERRNLGVKTTNWLDAFDTEFNYKSNNNSTRSNPFYERIGLNIWLNHKWSMYQTLASYQQTIDNERINQYEYFIHFSNTVSPMVKWNLSNHFVLMNKGVSSSFGNLLFTGISARVDRFTFGANGCVFLQPGYNQFQFAGNAAYIFKGTSNISTQATLVSFIENGINRWAYSQEIGISPFKKLRLSSTTIVGYLKNYADNEGLYLYNSEDITTFRTGVTGYWYLTKHIRLLYNYTFDTKQITSSITNYHQHSFSGGIIWKF